MLLSFPIVTDPAEVVGQAGSLRPTDSRPGRPPQSAALHGEIAYAVRARTVFSTLRPIFNRPGRQRAASRRPGGRHPNRKTKWRWVASLRTDCQSVQPGSARSRKPPTIQPRNVRSRFFEELFSCHRFSNFFFASPSSSYRLPHPELAYPRATVRVVGPCWPASVAGAPLCAPVGVVLNFRACRERPYGGQAEL